jgi:FkbM family methyltransferase
MKKRIKNIIKRFIPEFIISYYRLNIKDIRLNKKIRNFYSQLIYKEDLCFDIGANKGNRILPLLQLGAKVVAVEPQKECVDILYKRFRNKITIVQKGIGAKNEIRNFYVSENPVLSSFSVDFINNTKNDRFINNNWDSIEKIEIIKIDDLISLYGKPRFIKIDVEGFEFEVLQGLNFSIDFLSFEFILPELKKNAINCINRVNSISDKYVFNYSVNESMEFELKEWLSFDEMLNVIESFGDNKCWGDIYAKLVFK